MNFTATYRLQLTPDFGFDDAAELLPMLRRLGVSHLYLSPISEAVPGSRHGYDVVDHTRVRSEFGGTDGLDRLLDEAHDHGVGVVIDHVPNHVSVAQAELNMPWWETLRDGRDADAAKWFDIDWDAGNGKIIVPKLGSPLEDVLAAGDLAVGHGDRGPEITYGPLRFPLAPGTEELDVRDVVEQQHYRLAWWRDPARNVRRFFTIDDLVAVRVDEPDVADAVDTLPARLSSHPAFAGVRVDHVDGLAEPGAYLGQLRERIGDRWLLVEKILAAGETLANSWPVDGTTGYEHITVTEHTLLDPAAEAPLLGQWRDLAGDDSFDELEHHARREVLDGGLRPDLDRLVAAVPDVTDARSQFNVREAVTRSAIVETTLALDRYRTYLPGDPASAEVLADARRDALERVEDADVADEVERITDLIAEGGDVATRWQQLTGPVMAKGAEDRAFYRYFPLASLCEVGGRPGVFSTPVAAFHDHQRERQVDHATAMLADTTHDTKRSAGVRARSLALAAHADEWVGIVTDWLGQHGELVDDLDHSIVSLALQTAVTARPLTVERLHDYLVKAAREGDLITSWTEPDERLETALREVSQTLVAGISPEADSALAAFAATIEVEGATIGLRLLALQFTCPGVPDLYQGSPRSLLSLVDPDNRNEPDWDELLDLVDRVETSDTASASADGDTDLARTILTERILRLRRRRADAFGVDASYVELPVSGDGSEHVIAFARARGDEPLVVTIALRALATAPDPTGIHIELPDGSWRSLIHDDAQVIAGGVTRLADLVGQDGFVVLDRTDR